ncbi:M28 family metallopeptidase [Hirschia baltica]|uniref:Peptidase M28 n=1 Tax=Hirschia baltica (strain ATCC 49814 / DSM 5838 / IFAM 1418) TaxID=582402 RepID=C6XLY4_HIRBI|nr:M28 family metallopeptidase [Hirschia baltica]ACT59816.1 peptidase M28 [Hirschia baltica ATCC 49814]
MIRNALTTVISTVLLSATFACAPPSENESTPSSEAKPSTAAVETAEFIMPALASGTIPEISESDLSQRLEIIASDTFKGRAPGTLEGEASAQWVADEMARIGLEPAVDGSYSQTVKMNAQTIDLENSNLTLSIAGESDVLEPGSDAVFWTKRQTEGPIDFADSDLVFVGYGVNAPEYGWNDYDGIDMTGKTAVILINDPGFETADPELFNGKSMTYYGRWTYKYEEAARQGADAAIIIHETAPAAYGWNVVSGSWSGEQADLVRAGDGMDRIPMEAWISNAYGEKLFAHMGTTYADMKKAAYTKGFKAIPMEGIKASGSITQTVTRKESQNIAGVVKGKTAPDEYMLYMAHWDHLGEKKNFATEDSIHNGAIDNASGVSLMLEIAEAFAAGEQPDRSIIFLAVTLEESGLLGSAYFAENPFIPLNKIVAGVNTDAIFPRGLSKNMEIIGSGSSELEDRLEDILKTQDRYVSPDSTPQNGYFYRSDHISLAKKGVPVIYADGGADLVEGGVEAGLKFAAEYTANDYHKPSDEYNPDWDFAGVAQDAQAFHALGLGIANSTDWPNWYEGNEFRAIRDESLSK